MKRNHPWPEKGDKAFTDEEGGENAFYLREIFPYYPYRAEAFKSGADLLLAAHLAGGNLGLGNELFFPIAYLYRHAMELWLKEIIRAGVGLNHLSPAEIPKDLRTHNLSELWDLAKKAIIGIWEDGPEVATVENVILEFFAADPAGVAFRYDGDHGRTHVENMPKVIDPIRLRQTMDNTCAFLSSTANGAIDSLDYQQRAAGCN